MQLSKKILRSIKAQPGLIIPEENIFSLPEKVLQFGTGVLLRGLPDYFIDKANRQGIFNGRIVVVKSTSQGVTDAFSQQDGLYTQCVKGIEDGQNIEEYIINSSISRVLSAHEEWSTILQCAHSADMQVIISNTTEVGITLVNDDIHSDPPLSFPGKLLSFLFERYKKFGGTAESGMVIIPTELIPDNGQKLRSIVIQLAEMNKLDGAFIQWLSQYNYFCGSLVDRIVPGKLPASDQQEAESKLGYTDELMILSESFRLWAIESDSPQVKKILSFNQVDEGVVIAPDIEKFRELKLRLLNGVHSFACGLAHLSGFKTVKQAMNDEPFSRYVQQLAQHEIAEALTGDIISFAEAGSFAQKVLDRFRNPFLDHQWLSIAVQYSSKMKMRNIPLLLSHYHKTDKVPEYMALGFAAYILFMNENGHNIQDDQSVRMKQHWIESGNESVVDKVLQDTVLWETDLSKLDGFKEAVKLNLQSLIQHGALATVETMQWNKTTA